MLRFVAVPAKVKSLHFAHLCKNGMNFANILKQCFPGLLRMLHPGEGLQALYAMA
jgi:hypothetical protein